MKCNSLSSDEESRRLKMLSRVSHKCPEGWEKQGSALATQSRPHPRLEPSHEEPRNSEHIWRLNPHHTSCPPSTGIQYGMFASYWPKANTNLETCFNITSCSIARMHALVARTTYSVIVTNISHMLGFQRDTVGCNAAPDFRRHLEATTKLKKSDSQNLYLIKNGTGLAHLTAS
jgi:hypothetical protein